MSTHVSIILRALLCTSSMKLYNHKTARINAPNTIISVPGPNPIRIIYIYFIIIVRFHFLIKSARFHIPTSLNRITASGCIQYVNYCQQCNITPKSFIQSMICQETGRFSLLSLHRVDVDSVSDISEIHGASIFRD
jgi:hypothetical protein